MRYTTVEFPYLTADVPESSDPDNARAYGYLATAIAYGLEDSRDGRLHIEVIHDARGLSVRVTAIPKLARRERQKVRAICDKLMRKVPSLRTCHDIQDGAGRSSACAYGLGNAAPKAEEGPAFLAAEDIEPPPPPPDAVKVFDITMINAALRGLSTGGIEREATQRLVAMLQRIRERGPYRARSQPLFTWKVEIEQLRTEHPNFAMVIDTVIRPHLALLARGARRLRMPPVLLVGGPGVGKTAFARRVARLFGSTFAALDLATASNGGDLAGSSTFWSNFQPGLLLKAIGWGLPGREAVCDPVILLDEVDKVSADRYDPHGPLFGLLEPASAEHFEDQSLPGVPFDASNVRWILTANDASGIPSPIVSRTQVFEIRALTRKETQEMAQRRLGLLVEQYGIDFDAALPDDLLEATGQLSPREIGLLLEGAVGSAVADDRRRLEAKDWRHLVRRPGRRPMGFV
jgi:hypothetical protein